MSDLAAGAMSVLAIISLVLLIGLISDYIRRKTVVIDIPLVFGEFIQWEIWWRACPIKVHVARFIHPVMLSMLRRFLGVDAEGRIIAEIMCSAPITRAMEIIVPGCIVVGMVATSTRLLVQTYRLISLGVDLNEHERRNLYLFGLWIASISQEHLTRFGVIIGLVVVSNMIYLRSLEYSRRLGQFMGETILEPN